MERRGRRVVRAEQHVGGDDAVVHGQGDVECALGVEGEDGDVGDPGGSRGLEKKEVVSFRNDRGWKEWRSEVNLH